MPEGLVKSSSFQYHLAIEKCARAKSLSFFFSLQLSRIAPVLIFLTRSENFSPAISWNSERSSETKTAYCRVSFSKPYSEFLTNFRVGSVPHANIVFCILRYKH